uniref:Transcription factor E4F1 n=1 Tax=Ceratitis capitata TaxID=7213 RepID=W8BRP7_CERCA
MVGLCRLCAAVRKTDMLLPMTKEVCQKIKECFTMEMCHYGDKLPKYTCCICFEALQKAFAFFKKVQESQESLKLLFADTKPKVSKANNGQTLSRTNNKQVENIRPNAKPSELDIEAIIDETNTHDKLQSENLETNNEEDVFRLYQIIQTVESSDGESLLSENDIKSNSSPKHFLENDEIELFLLEQDEVRKGTEDIAEEQEENDDLIMLEEANSVNESTVSDIILNDTVGETLRTNNGKTLKETGKNIELDKKKACETSHLYVELRDTCGKTARDQNIALNSAKKFDETKCNQCSYCDKKFTLLGNLRVHEKIHSGLKEFTCEICDRQFHQKHNLEIHMYSHVDDKAYKCKICKKSLKTPNSLEKHLLIHNDIKKFSCDYCDKRFRTKDSKCSHERVHTGEKPFKCKYCDRSFRFRSGLMGHVNLHTGERPYSCTHCSRQFTNWGNMNKHIKRCHNRQDDIK